MLKFRSWILLVLVVILAIPAMIGSSPARAADKPLITVMESKTLGKYLAGKDGMTLYSFPPDQLDVSVCYDKCATAWPPLLVKSADEITVQDGVPGDFGTTKRKDDTLQVTYNGIPLYYWFKDKAAGETTGHGVGRIWWVVPPATVYSQRIPKLGTVLVGPKGMTLYLYTKDTPDTSNCYDKCATAWPPLLVKSADEIIKGVNLVGKFGTTTRKDGTLQVTYNGWPLYYWQKDTKRGDGTGEDVGKVWYTIVPETVGVSNTKDLGDFLVTSDGLTLYTFNKDTAGVSNCKDDCAKAWPPFTSQDPTDRIAMPAVLKGKLELIKRDEKTMQYAYNGMPLYFFKDDKAPGDTKGNGVGGAWAVVKP